MELELTPIQTHVVTLATIVQFGYQVYHQCDNKRFASRRVDPKQEGEKGRRIRELTSVVQKRFNFPKNSVELYAEKINTRGLCNCTGCVSSLQTSWWTCCSQFMERVPNPGLLNLPSSSIYASGAQVALHKWQPNTPDGQGMPFLFTHGKTASNSSSGGFMRMFKGFARLGNEDWKFPKALTFTTPGIRSSAVVAVTFDKQIITEAWWHYCTS